MDVRDDLSEKSRCALYAIVRAARKSEITHITVVSRILILTRKARLNVSLASRMTNEVSVSCIDIQQYDVINSEIAIGDPFLEIAMIRG